jgi:four helix bundle protein
MGTSYADLIVWQRAMDFVETLYHATARFPREEIYGLTSQMRRAAVSIPSNIAEGQCRQTSRDFRNFLAIARGSLAELETQILLSHRLNYITAPMKTDLVERAAEIGRLLTGLYTSLARTTRGPSP